MKKKFSFKSAYLFPFLGVFLFLLIFIMLYQMRYSISQFVMEQASTDTEIITREKASLFSSLLENHIIEAENILDYSISSFKTIDNEFDAREELADYFRGKNCTKFFYIMNDERVYDQDARLYLTIEDNLETLIEKSETAVSEPFIDDITGMELIIIYIDNPDDQSEVKGIAAYYKASSLYMVSEFFEAESGSYYILDKNGNAVFSQDKGITLLGIMTEHSFAEDEISDLQAFITADGTTETKISSYDSTVISISKISNMSDWYAVSILQSSIISEKTASVVDQTMLISGIIMAVFLVLIMIFLASDRNSTRQMERLQSIDTIAECSNQFKFELDAQELLRVNKTTKYAILYINILNFKHIKQLLPSAEVNTMVKNLSDVLKKSVIKNLETYGRTSDGRFVVLIIYKEIFEIQNRYEEIVKNLNDIGPVSGYAMRTNAGVYCVDRTSRYHITEMIDRAAFAQNSLKEDSSQTLEFYHQKSHEDLMKTIALEGFMEKALKNDEFVIYLQPKYDIQHNRIDGAEALVRWIRPNEGIVSPSQFINLFERSGYISALDKFVFTEICKFQNNRSRENKRVIPISINVSRASAEKEDFLDYYVSTKKKYQVPDRFLELEFTESRALEDYETLGKRITELKQNGFVCSIDDFGAGYSSFKALQALDFDIIKLDASFLENPSGNEEKNMNLISGVIAMARSLKMKVIAEGVETKAELKMLRELKCDVIQGYLYAHPMNMADYSIFVEKALNMKSSSFLADEEG
ncbi:MAG: EAL domain-containing protein [Clostridia bacterium]